MSQVWSTDATCSSLASTCQAYVQDNPEAFVDTYWSINSLKVYQQSGAAATTPSSSEATNGATSSPSAVYATPTTFSTFTTLSSSSYSPPYNAPYTSYGTSHGPQTTSSYYTNIWSSQSWPSQSWPTTWSQPQASAAQSWNGWQPNGGGRHGGPP